MAKILLLCMFCKILYVKMMFNLIWLPFNMPPTQQMFHIWVHGNISCNHLIHYGADAQMLVTDHDCHQYVYDSVRYTGWVENCINLNICDSPSYWFA